jgi:hypothetical protein
MKFGWNDERVEFSLEALPLLKCEVQIVASTNRHVDETHGHKDTLHNISTLESYKLPVAIGTVLSNCGHFGANIGSRQPK